MKYFRCPGCEEEIDRLYYSVPVEDYGTYFLPEDNGDDRLNAHHGEHECEGSDNHGETTFRCTCCDTNLSLSELVISEINNDDDKELDESLTEEKEEANTEVIETLDSKYVARNDSRKPDNYLKCECGNVTFVSNDDMDDEDIECKCGLTLDPTELDFDYNNHFNPYT